MTLNSLPNFDPAAQKKPFTLPNTQHPAGDKVSGQADISRRAAWLREMERAQVAHWFMPFENRGAGFVSSSSSTARTPVSLGALNQLAAPVRGMAAVAEANPKTDRLSPDPARGDLGPLDRVEALTPLTSSSALKDETTVTSSDTDEPSATGDGHTTSIGSLRNDLMMSQGSTAHLAQALNGHFRSGTESTSPLFQTSAPVTANCHILPLTALTQPVKLDGALGAIATLEIASTQVLLFTALDPTVGSDGDAEHAIQTGPSMRLAPRLSLGPGEPSRIRLHAQWFEDAVTVWLGMDGSAEQIVSQASVVIAQLQRHLSGQGQRLSLVICNGQVLFDSAALTTPVRVASFEEALVHQTPARPMASQTITRQNSPRRMALADSVFPSPITSQETS